MYATRNPLLTLTFIFVSSYTLYPRQIKLMQFILSDSFGLGTTWIIPLDIFLNKQIWQKRIYILHSINIWISPFLSKDRYWEVWGMWHSVQSYVAKCDGCVSLTGPQGMWLLVSQRVFLHDVNIWINGNSDRLLFSWAPKSLQMVMVAMKLKDACSLGEKLW